MLLLTGAFAVASVVSVWDVYVCGNALGTWEKQFHPSCGRIVTDGNGVANREHHVSHDEIGLPQH